MMVTDRINSRLPKPLAEHVKRMVGSDGCYETPSEYIRDLIRRDMKTSDSEYARKSILDGYRDLAASNYFKSTGNFKGDMELLKEKENANSD